MKSIILHTPFASFNRDAKTSVDNMSKCFLLNGSIVEIPTELSSREKRREMTDNPKNPFSFIYAA